MKKKGKLILLIFVIVLAVGVMVWRHQLAWAIVLAMAGVILAAFSLFEKGDTAPEKLVLLALLSALAAVGRVMFSALPSVQPASFIIMMTGVVLGGDMGFLTGALTALSSNLVLGQGPWTLWQMLCWGGMGWLSGKLSRLLVHHKWLFCAYGVMWGFVFGWVMNAWFVLAGYGDASGWRALLVAGMASFPMDLAHGITNGLLILLLSTPLMRLLNRIVIKYGLREKEKLS